jgi:hypothetical protein
MGTAQTRRRRHDGAFAYRSSTHAHTEGHAHTCTLSLSRGEDVRKWAAAVTSAAFRLALCSAVANAEPAPPAAAAAALAAAGAVASTAGAAGIVAMPPGMSPPIMDCMRTHSKTDTERER